MSTSPPARPHTNRRFVWQSASERRYRSCVGRLWRGCCVLGYGGEGAQHREPGAQEAAGGVSLPLYRAAMWRWLAAALVSCLPMAAPRLCLVCGLRRHVHLGLTVGRNLLFKFPYLR